MATCSPYEPHRFVTAAERADANIGAAVRQADESGIYTEVVEGSRAAFDAQVLGQLKEILPFNFEQLLRYFQKEGYVKVNKALTKAAGDGANIYTSSDKLTPKQVMLVAKVTKSYLMSTAGATRQMASNFLLKVKAGEDALNEGLAFAKQMRHTSQFGGFVLGWDQEMGRAVAFQSKTPRATRVAEQAAVATGEEASRLGNYTDLFQSIAQKMNDPATMNEAINELIGLARRVEFLDDPAKIAKVSTSMQLAGGAWQEVFINGLLSGPATFAANAAGMGWAIARPILQYGAASSYAALGLPGSKPALQAAAEAAASLSAINGAWGDAWQLAKRAFNTESSIYQAARQPGVSSVPVDAYLRQQGMAPLDDALASTLDLVGSTVRLPSRALLGTDEFAKHLVVRGEVAARAIRRAAENGIDLTSKKAFDDYMEQEMNLAFHLGNPGDPPEAKWRLRSIYDPENKIMLEADRATFQEENSWANKVSQALEVPVLGPMLKPMIPFVRTPLNILKQGFVESTGLGAAMKAASTLVENGGNPTATVLALQKQMLEDPGETFRVAGQIAVTTVAAAAIYTGVMSGAIVGGGPGRWTPGGKGSAAQKAFDGWLSENGRSRYSIQVGDQNIPFDRFGEPVSIVLRMVADAGMYSSYADYASQEEWLAGIAGIMATGLYQASFLQGLQDVMGLITDPDAANGAKPTRAVQNWLSTQTPFGGFLNYVRRVEDPYKRAYGGATFIEAMRVHEDFYGSIFGRLNDRLPGVGKAPVMVDQITGRPVPITPGGGPNGLNPLQMAIPFLPRGSEGNAGPWSALFKIRGFYQEKRPDKVRLTNAEQQQFNELMSKAKINGQTVAEFITAYEKRSDVQQLIQNRAALKSDLKTQIVADMDKVINQYAQLAWLQMLQRNDSVSRRAALVEARDQSLKQNDLNEAKSIDAALDELFRASRAGN
jgi:hypothetical protein